MNLIVCPNCMVVTYTKYKWQRLALNDTLSLKDLSVSANKGTPSVEYSKILHLIYTLIS